jgi:hypothetical protein
MRRIAIASVACVLLAGCTFGTTARETRLAVAPRGAEVTLATQGGRVTGELLAVQDSTLVVLSGGVVTSVPFGIIRSGNVEVAGAVATWSPEKLAAMRQVSRFPQGMNAELLQRVLARYGQRAVAGAGG